MAEYRIFTHLYDDDGKKQKPSFRRLCNTNLEILRKACEVEIRSVHEIMLLAASRLCAA